MMFAGKFAVFLILTTIWSRHLAMSFDTIWRFNVVGLGAVWFVFAWVFAWAGSLSSSVKGKTISRKG
jgi:hypothetical protein